MCVVFGLFAVHSFAMEEEYSSDKYSQNEDGEKRERHSIVEKALFIVEKVREAEKQGSNKKQIKIIRIIAYRAMCTPYNEYDFTNTREIEKIILKKLKDTNEIAEKIIIDTGKPEKLNNVAIIGKIREMATGMVERIEVSLMDKISKYEGEISEDSVKDIAERLISEKISMEKIVENMTKILTKRQGILCKKLEDLKEKQRKLGEHLKNLEKHLKNLKEEHLENLGEEINLKIIYTEKKERKLEEYLESLKEKQRKLREQLENLKEEQLENLGEEINPEITYTEENIRGVKIKLESLEMSINDLERESEIMKRAMEWYENKK